MKKLFLFLSFIIASLSIKAQFPNNQSAGSASTLYTHIGANKASVGGILTTYADTAAANAVLYLKGVAGAEIFTTTDNIHWIRNSTVTAWIKQASGSTGTVTSVGGLSPLFTVSNPTTTPTFSQISQSQNLVYASPNGSSGVPTFRSLVAGDLPSLGYWSILGNAGTTAGTNFLGTTDDKDLVLKRNSLQSIRLKDNYRVEIGNGPLASGQFAVSIGNGSIASGTNSTALNSGQASGNNTVSFGTGSLASGNYAVAVGVSSISSGEGSFSANESTNSSGVASSSFGTETKSKSYSGFVIGSYNDSTDAADQSAHNGLNRVFQIGIGTSDAARANGLTMLQDGTLYLPPTAAQNNAADSMMVILPSTGKVGYRAIPSGGGGSSGTPNYLPKYDVLGTGLTATSKVYDNGTFVGVGTTSPVAQFDVKGKIRTTNSLLIDTIYAHPSDGVGYSRNAITIPALDTAEHAAPFLLGTSANGGASGVNHVMYMGWNLDPGGGKNDNLKSAVGEGWEQRWRPGGGIDYTEKHELYSWPNTDTVVRIGSYTCDNVTHGVQLYHTVGAFGLRQGHQNNGDYFAVIPGTIKLGDGVQNQSVRNFGIQYDTITGIQFTLSNPSSARNLIMKSGISIMSVPGATFQSGAVRIDGSGAIFYPENDNSNVIGRGDLRWKEVWGVGIYGNNFYGGSTASANLNLNSTSHATKGYVGVTTAATATANFGTLSIGNGAFDGSTTGKFVGSSNGTLIAANSESGFTGNFLDMQLNGSPILKVYQTGGNTTNVDAGGSRLNLTTVTGILSLNDGNSTATFSSGDFNVGNRGLSSLRSLTFQTDNTYDIGASAATRPRTGYFGTSLVSPLYSTTSTGQLSNGTSYFSFNGNNAIIGTASANRAIVNSTGDLFPNANNSQDIGISGNAWRSGYFATSLIIGTGTSQTTLSVGLNSTAFTNNAGQWGLFSGNTWTMGQWGAGVPANLTASGAGAGNANRTGIGLNLQSGLSTGSGTGGDINFQYSTTGSSGSSLNSYTTAMSILGTNGNVGIGTASPAATALLDVTSTTKGFLPPRWTNTQMAAISSPATGLLGYNTDAGAMYVYNGTSYKSAGLVSGSFSQVGTATTTFTVTFGGTQPNATYKVNVTPTAALSAALFYVTNKTTTTFDVTYLAGLTGTVTFDYTLTQ